MPKLTATTVKNAKRPGRYGDGEGLYLVVKPSGARSWVLRVVQPGVGRRDIGLGGVNTGTNHIEAFLTEPIPLIEKRLLTLAEARELSRELRAIARTGRDPAAIKRQARRPKVQILTFQQCAERLHCELAGTWSNPKHAADWLNSLTAYAFPSLGKVPVDKITAPMVRESLLPHWLTRPETSRRVRQRIRHVIEWAVAHEMRPALDLTRLQLPKQPRQDKHFAAMQYVDVPDFVLSLSSEAETTGRLALLFTIATAARSGETRGATWQEIDLAARRWTVPADRMKAKREHVVPLNDLAMSVLTRLHARSNEGLVFSGRNGKPVSDMTLLKILRDKQLPFTVHGFRSAFKDWAVEQTAFPDAVSEAALAHGDPDKVRGAYRRTDFLDMRRQLMAAWSDFMLGKPAAKDSNAVQKEGARMVG